MNEFSDLASEDARPRLALKYKGFQRLFSGQLIGLIGDQLFPIAMVGVLASRSNLPFSLGVVFGARFLGLSLLIIFSGVIADRLSRVQLLVASDAMRAAAVLGLLIAGLDAPVWTLALLTFAMGAGEAVFQPAYDAFIPDLVDEVALLSANATTNVLRSVGQFVGPALGAVIVTELGPTTALTIDAATFVVSSVAVLLAGRHVIARPPDQEVPQRSSMIKEALEGLQIVLKLRWLGLLQLMSLVHVLFAVGPWMVLLPVIASEGGSGLYGYGSALSAFALGGLVGAPPGKQDLRPAQATRAGRGQRDLAVLIGVLRPRHSYPVARGSGDVRSGRRWHAILRRCYPNRHPKAGPKLPPRAGVLDRLLRLVRSHARGAVPRWDPGRHRQSGKGCDGGQWGGGRRDLCSCAAVSCCSPIVTAGERRIPVTGHRLRSG